MYTHIVSVFIQVKIIAKPQPKEDIKMKLDLILNKDIEGRHSASLGSASICIFNVFLTSKRVSMGQAQGLNLNS